MKFEYPKRFSARDLQQLILDGWTVAGDRKTARRAGETITPIIYRQQQAKRSELLKALKPR